MFEGKKTQFKILELFIGGLFFLLITYTIFFGQKIPVSNGMGWDGSITRDILRHFSSFLNTHSLDIYNLQHLFPNAIFYLTAKLFNIPLTDQNILTGAAIINYLFMVTAVIFFYLISQKLQINQAVRILAIVGLFVNFATLKFSGYYLLLPDVSVFSLIIILYYAYLK
jgi:hypothetical protein